MRTYYVYMLRCIDGTFYTGMTNDIIRRFDEHCAGNNPTSYTHTRRPLRLIYAGEFDRPDDAIAFEKQLKGWSHKKKRAFAARDWPLLKRLATATRHPEQRRGTAPIIPIKKTHGPSAHRSFHPALSKP